MIKNKYRVKQRARNTSVTCGRQAHTCIQHANGEKKTEIQTCASCERWVKGGKTNIHNEFWFVSCISIHTSPWQQGKVENLLFFSFCTLANRMFNCKLQTLIFDENDHKLDSPEMNLANWREKKNLIVYRKMRKKYVYLWT